jgi:uncharacterized membrane protein YhaH (DUF805 family)
MNPRLQARRFWYSVGWVIMGLLIGLGFVGVVSQFEISARFAVTMIILSFIASILFLTRGGRQ